MNDDFHLFSGPEGGAPPVDPDVALITAYLARELSLVQIVAVEDRLASDAEFRASVSPILEAWSLSDALAAPPAATPAPPARRWVLTPAQRAAGWERHLAEERVHATRTPDGAAEEAPRRSSWRAAARIAAGILLVALPMLGFGQAVIYVVHHMNPRRFGTSGVPSRLITRSTGGGLQTPRPAPPIDLTPEATRQPDVEARQPATLTRVPVTQDSAPPILRMMRELSVGGAAQRLSTIFAVHVGRQGQLLVSQAGGPVMAGRSGLPWPAGWRLLVFDSTGRLTATLGERMVTTTLGESRGMPVTTYFGWVGDSIWASEGSGRGAAPTRLYRATGDQAGVIPNMQARPQAGDAGRIPVLRYSGALATFPDGSLLVTAAPDTRDPLVTNGTFTSGSRFVVLGPDGIIRRIVGQVPYGQTTVMHEVGGGFFCGAVVPFANRPRWAVSPDGSRIGLVSADIRSKDGGDLRLTVLRPNGDTIVRRDVPFRGIPIDAAAIRRELAARHADLAASSDDCERTLATNYLPQASAIVPPAEPPIKGMVMGRDGTVWLDVVVRGWSGTLALDAAGAVIGRLRLPPGAVLAEAERNRIWVVEHTGNDWSVVRYRIER